MAQIELAQIEIDMLREVLKKALSELSLEIAFKHHSFQGSGDQESRFLLRYS